MNRRSDVVSRILLFIFLFIEFDSMAATVVSGGSYDQPMCTLDPVIELDGLRRDTEQTVNKLAEQIIAQKKLMQSTEVLQTSLDALLKDYVIQAKDLFSEIQKTPAAPLSAPSIYNLFGLLSRIASPLPPSPPKKGCDSNACPEVTIHCGTLRGNAGSCDRDTCTIYMSNTDCYLLGLDRGDKKKPEDIAPAPNKPPVKDADQAMARCTLLHELHHAGDGPACPYCQSEVDSYEESIKCLETIITESCGNPSRLSAAECDKLKSKKEASEINKKYNECLCKHFSDREKEKYKNGTCALCEAEVGRSTTTGYASDQYCKPYEDPPVTPPSY